MEGKWPQSHQIFLNWLIMKTYITIFALLLALNLVSGQVRAYGKYSVFGIPSINMYSYRMEKERMSRWWTSRRPISAMSTANARLVPWIFNTFSSLGQTCFRQLTLDTLIGIFHWLQSDWRCRRVSQVLRQDWWVQLVVMGASLWVVHALRQLHR